MTRSLICWILNFFLGYQMHFKIILGLVNPGDQALISISTILKFSAGILFDGKGEGWNEGNDSLVEWTLCPQLRLYRLYKVSFLYFYKII